MPAKKKSPATVNASSSAPSATPPEVTPFQLAELAARVLPAIAAGAPVAKEHEERAMNTAVRLYDLALKAHDRMRRGKIPEGIEAELLERQRGFEADLAALDARIREEEREKLELEFSKVCLELSKKGEDTKEGWEIPTIEAMKLIVPDEIKKEGPAKTTRKAKAMLKHYRAYMEMRAEACKAERPKSEVPWRGEHLVRENTNRFEFRFQVIEFMWAYRKDPKPYEKRVSEKSGRKGGKKSAALREREGQAFP